jgi:hypothetical protein
VSKKEVFLLWWWNVSPGGIKHGAGKEEKGRDLNAGKVPLPFVWRFRRAKVKPLVCMFMWPIWTPGGVPGHKQHRQGAGQTLNTSKIAVYRFLSMLL